MERIVNWFLIVLLPSIVVIAGLLPIVFFIFYWRNAQAKKSRHNPLTRALLRSPGHSLRQRIDDLDIEVDSLLVVWILLLPLLCVVHLFDSYLRGTPETTTRFVLEGLLALGACSFIGRLLFKKLEALRNYRLGLEGELATAQELDQLMLEGCRVFHDIPIKYGNIDHVVVSKSGVYSVNTKMRGKPKDGEGRAEITVDHNRNVIQFPDFLWKIPTEQLETEARCLSDHLTSSVGDKVAVEPMLALPGWFVAERIGRGSVYVFNPMKPKRFFVQSRDVLSPEMITRIAHQLEQLCRDVEPSFRNDPSWVKSK